MSQGRLLARVRLNVRRLLRRVWSVSCQPRGDAALCSESGGQATMAQRHLDAALLDAAAHADVAAVRETLARGANPNAIRRRSRYVFGVGHFPDAHDSALLLALKSGQLAAIDVALTLREFGADPAYVNRHGESAAVLLHRVAPLVTDVFGTASASLSYQLALRWAAEASRQPA